MDDRDAYMLSVNQPTQPKPIRRHADKLAGKAKAHTVLPLDPTRNSYTVISGGSGKRYVVIMFDDSRGSCDCDWSTKRPAQVAENGGACGCSHVLAVVSYIAEGHGQRSSVWSDEASAKRQHKSTGQVGDGLLVTRTKTTKRTRVQADFFGLVDKP